MRIRIRDMLFAMGGLAIGTTLKSLDSSLFSDFLSAAKNSYHATESSRSSYQPSTVEEVIMDNLIVWGWDKAQSDVGGCHIWKNQSNNELYEPLQAFRKELKDYYNAIDEFTPTITNIKKELSKDTTRQKDICKSLRLHPDGLAKGIFPKSSSHNVLSHSSTSGYIEPLTTPMRHPDFCFDRKALYSLQYLIHDFEAMCLSIKPTSNLILIDMGASLSFHGEKVNEPPMIQLLHLYEKFGFRFDHIYSFEISFTKPEKVFSDLLPEEYMASYHWINVGVSAAPGHKLNPLESILRKYTEDDFIVVKLDIDTPDIEVPLAKQLLEDKSFHGGLINQFYFEHHVNMKEIAESWRNMKGSLKDTFDLFYGLRQMGISAHFWV